MVEGVVRLCLVFRKPNLQTAGAVVCDAAGACLVYQMLLELIMEGIEEVERSSELTYRLRG